MKVLFDIVHPAHVHFFKNIIRGIEEKGHQTAIIARDKDVTLKLLDLYGFKYQAVGFSGAKNRFQQFRELVVRDLSILHLASLFKPDFILTRNPAGVQAARFIGATGIFDTDDGRAAGIHFKAAAPFAHLITSPDSLLENYGKKHIKYPGYKQTAYLHPDHFSPNPDVLDMLGVKKGDPFFIVRFVDMVATHDVNESGLSFDARAKVIEMLQEHGRVFISSEGQLPIKWTTLKFSIPPHMIHDAMAYAKLIVGDSQTMTAEAAVIGTPSLRVSSFSGRLGYLNELEDRYGITFSCHPKNVDLFFQKIDELLNDPKKLNKMKSSHAQIISDKCNVAQWFVDFLEKITMPKIHNNH
jgi:uncharacterized protein